MAWKRSARFLSWIYILSLPASFREGFKTGPGGMLSTSENTKMRSKGNSQGESRAAPQKNSRWKVKGSVHKDKSTLQVGTGSRLRPSSLEAETRKQALRGNQQTCSWAIPAPKTAGGSSWGSVFKCMVFIGGGFYASGFPVSWSEPASTSSPDILSTDIWLLQWVINRNEKQKQNLLWTFVEFPFCSVVKVWIYQMTK